MARITPQLGADRSADSAEALVLGAAGAEVSAEDAAEGVGDSGGEPETSN